MKKTICLLFLSTLIRPVLSAEQSVTDQTAKQVTHSSNLSFNDFSQNLNPDSQRSNRFIKIDPQANTPIIDQFLKQAIELFQTRGAYLGEQKQFVESLREKAKKQNDANLETIHPFFHDAKSEAFQSTDQEIIATLEGAIVVYGRNISATNNLVDYLHKPGHKIKSLFEFFFSSRNNYLQGRDPEHIKINIIPQTKPSSINGHSPYNRAKALESIATLRYLDECLFALFYNLTRQELSSINERFGFEYKVIMADCGLMKFLVGEVDIPFDPDTTYELKNLPKKDRKVYVPDLRDYLTVKVPIIPKSNQDLYDRLSKKLPEPLRDNSDLPDHVKSFLTKKQTKPVKSKKKKGQNAIQKDTQQILATQGHMDPALSSSNSTEKTTNTQNPPVGNKNTQVTKQPKPAKPVGGWSPRDQQRNLEAKAKISDITTSSTSSDDIPTQFQPIEPITLSRGQYTTLQVILDETSPAYTLTFDRVKDLLEGLGIRVERNGGSHAHIYTPGHNVKTLVDIHYGWTDKFGKGTMASLRTLMQNLGLDNPQNVRVNK